MTVSKQEQLAIQNNNLWVKISPDPSVRLRLFCFPYSGGGASSFRTWQASFPCEIAVCAVQLPGRENRLKDPPLTRLEPLLEALVEALEPHLDLPFVFYGHSLGALIAFELSRYLRARGGAQPLHLYASSHRAPQLRPSSPAMYQLSDVEFIEQLRRLKGTSEAVLQNADLMRLLLPLLRADLAIHDTYVYKEEAPLNYPISVYGATEDPRVPKEELLPWNAQTDARFTLQMFAGDHFFIHNQQQAFLSALARDVTLSTTPPPLAQNT